MAQRRVGIIIHGATGRIGSTQHLRNLLAIRADGGVLLRNGDRLLPDPLLSGRNPAKLKALAEANGGLRWTTELDTALSGDDEVFMECTASGFRVPLVERAIAAGKHIHIEKPTAPSLAEAVALAGLADVAGVKHAVVQDKLFLPGFSKLRLLRDAGFFGRMLSVRLESGWFVFDGTLQPGQRPSWNYRSPGGGLAFDMLSHYRYMIEGLAAPFVRVACLTTTAIPERIDERGERYRVDVDDSVYCVAQLADGIACTISASWATRVRRDDLIQVQIDGTQGSAVAGGHRCVTQALVNTPSPRWNTEAGQESDFRTQWAEVPGIGPFGSSFRLVWERFLRHLGEGGPCPTLWDGARMVQLAEACQRSSRGEGWVELPALV